MEAIFINQLPATITSSTELCSTLPCPGHSTRIQADPGGSKWNGRNLVGIQVNSNLIPSKNNLIIQTQIFIHSRSFQVIPGGIQVFQVIPGGIQVKKRMIILATFQVHSHHIPGHSRSIPGPFPPYSGFIPGLLQVHSSHILGTFQPYSWSIPGQFIILYINYLIHGFNIEPPNIWHSKRNKKSLGYLQPPVWELGYQAQRTHLASFGPILVIATLRTLLVMSKHRLNLKFIS